MKVKSSTIKARRGGERANQSSRPTGRSNAAVGSRGNQKQRTRSGTRTGVPHMGGRPPKKNNNLLLVGLASFFGFVLLIIIIVAVGSGTGDREPAHQPKSAAKASSKRRRPSKPGHYGAKYAEYDERMVMTEESQMAKDRKKRLSNKKR